jgi:formylmethanofuran dehydrogenase subunit E-like metal-binding protein
MGKITAGRGGGRRPKTYNLPKSLTDRVTVLAKAQGMSESLVAERLLLDSLGQEETNVKLMTDPVVMPAMVKAMSEPAVMRAILDAIRDDLGDDQLQLFGHAMNAVAGIAAGVQVAPVGSVRRVASKEVKSRRKK